MKRYTIRCRGTIMGTYPGETEDDALDAHARDEKHADFKARCVKLKLKRDDHTVTEVEE